MKYVVRAMWGSRTGIAGYELRGTGRGEYSSRAHLLDDLTGVLNAECISKLKPGFLFSIVLFYLEIFKRFIL